MSNENTPTEKDLIEAATTATATLRAERQELAAVRPRTRAIDAELTAMARKLHEMERFLRAWS